MDLNKEVSVQVSGKILSCVTVKGSRLILVRMAVVGWRGVDVVVRSRLDRDKKIFLDFPEDDAVAAAALRVLAPAVWEQLRRI
jgi:hypothetical protein